MQIYVRRVYYLNHRRHEMTPENGEQARSCVPLSASHEVLHPWLGAPGHPEEDHKVGVANKINEIKTSIEQFSQNPGRSDGGQERAA